MSLPAKLVRQDVIGGLVLVALGAAGLYYARGYALGTLSVIGPGYLPRAYCTILVVLGALLTVKGWLRPGATAGPVSIGPAALIMAALLVFALSIERLGLFVAVFATVLVSALASQQFRIVRTLVLAVVLSAGSVLLFIHALGLPIPVWPF